jgi:DNA-binding response OmpR family regulator
MSEHILIVDDNIPITEVMRDILEMYGYRTTVRYTGKETVPYIVELQPDLVLLDVILDEYNGLDICREVKQVAEAKHIPIVMVSATHNLMDTTKHQCEPNAFISKPFDMQHFINVVETQLSLR